MEPKKLEVGEGDIEWMADILAAQFADIHLIGWFQENSDEQIQVVIETGFESMRATGMIPEKEFANIRSKSEVKMQDLIRERRAQYVEPQNPKTLH